MSMWKIVFLTLKEYHKKRYIYYLLLVCIGFVVLLNLGFETRTNRIEYAIRVAEGGIGLLCTLSMILLGMRTYSPGLESGSIVLDITKPIKRINYFWGKFLANMIVGLICAGSMILYTTLLIHGYGRVLEFLLRTFTFLIIPFFILSITSLLNLYLPAKATGISAFILHISYLNILDYLERSNIEPTIQIMNTRVSVMSVGIFFISIALIVCGVLLFDHKEL
ncbi:MAG: hypothetical protein PVF58_10125 [Candidatus Methanofastidiosia archaeon]|jgi:ABC-type transport system involved in multi-copper enzyme maturation permease subunit